MSKGNKGISNDKTDGKKTTSWSNKRQQEKRIEEWENEAGKEDEDEDDDQDPFGDPEPPKGRKRLLGEDWDAPNKSIRRGLIEEGLGRFLDSFAEEIIAWGELDIEDVDSLRDEIKDKVDEQIKKVEDDIKASGIKYQKHNTPSYNGDTVRGEEFIEWIKDNKAWLDSMGISFYWDYQSSESRTTWGGSYYFNKSIRYFKKSLSTSARSGSTSETIEKYEGWPTLGIHYKSSSSASFFESYSNSEGVNYSDTYNPVTGDQDYASSRYIAARYIGYVYGGFQYPNIKSYNEIVDYETKRYNWSQTHFFHYDDGAFRMTFGGSTYSGSININFKSFNADGEIVIPIPERLIINKDKEMNSDCCQMIAEIHSVISPDDYPVKLPKDFGENKNEQIEIATFSQYFTYWMLRMNEAQGSFPQEIKITDTDLLKEGNQSETIKFESLSDAIMEIYGLLIKLIISQPVDQELALRTALATSLTRDTVVKNNVLIDGVVEYLGFKTREKTVKIQTPFNIEGEGFDQILQNSERRVLVEENDDSTTLQMTLRNIEQAVAIIRAVHWRQLNPNGDIREQILNDVKAAARDMIGGSSSDGIERFNEKNKGEAILEKAT